MAWTAGAGIGLKQRELLTVRFSLAESDYSLEVTVSRILAAGIGVSFARVDAGVLDVIKQHAFERLQAQPAGGHGAQSDFDRDQVIGSMKGNYIAKCRRVRPAPALSPGKCPPRTPTILSRHESDFVQCVTKPLDLG